MAPRSLTGGGELRGTTEAGRERSPIRELLGGSPYGTELIALIVSGIIVVAFGLGLVGFAALVAVRRLRAERFLRLFASSAKAHYTEQFSRLVVGTAIVLYSPSMWYSYLFEYFGWLIIITSVGLLLAPWRWHQRLAERGIPLVIRYLTTYAVGAFALGAFILYGASRYMSF
jgi:hypothetical protein